MAERTPEAIQRLKADWAVHAKYSKARHKCLMEQCAKSKYGLLFLMPDQLGTICVHFPYTWSEEAATAYLDSGTVPIKMEDLAEPNTKCIVIVFAQIDGSGPVPRDVGKPAFLHATHSKVGKVMYIVEAPRHEYGENMVFLIPGDEFDTADLRRRHDEYLATGIWEQQDVVLRTSGDLRQFEGSPASLA